MHIPHSLNRRSAFWAACPDDGTATRSIDTIPPRALSRGEIELPVITRLNPGILPAMVMT